jgi:hypothetical protein
MNDAEYWKARAKQEMARCERLEAALRDAEGFLAASISKEYGVFTENGPAAECLRSVRTALAPEQNK